MQARQLRQEVAAGSADLEAARVEAGAAEQRRRALEARLRAAQAEGGELRGQLLQVRSICLLPLMYGSGR